MRKKLGLVLICVALVGSVCMMNNTMNMAEAESNTSRKIERGFTDTKGHWGELSIVGAVQKGYVDGYQGGIFKPDEKVTRAEFIKMVDTALDISVSGTTTGKDWYAPYVNGAVSAGIHQWSDFTSGDWNTAMTRNEMARMAMRAATGDKNTDEKKWMYLATGAGLITGMDDAGKLGEDETTTRAQSVTIIERILSIKAGQKLSSDKYAVSNAEIVWHKTNIETMLPRYFSQRTAAKDRIDPKDMRAEADNGNVVTETEKYVVIDLDDPHDPNRNLIPPGTKWVEDTGQRKDLPSNAYVLLSVDRLIMKNNNYGLDFIRSGGVHLLTRLYDKTGQLKREGKLFKLAPLSIYNYYGSRYSSPIFRIEQGPINMKYVTGQILPKGNLMYDDSHSRVSIVHSKLADFGVTNITIAKYILDETVNQ